MNLARLDAWWQANWEKHQSRLVEMRGGCTCCISPPCCRCTDEITWDEALYLGFDPDEDIPVTKHDIGASKQSIMDITRSMFR